jgi:orotate phosphoribosyltransferase
MRFDEREFIHFLIKEGCIGFFEEPIKLTSGQESFWYINLRTLQNDFKKLDSFRDFILSFLMEKGTKFSSPLVGVPESATLPAIEVNRKFGNSDYLYLRSSLKSHGVSGKFPYSLSPIDISGREFVLLEDTLTTGDSAIKTALNLYEGGANVNSIIVVCYREDKRWGGMLPHEYIDKHLGVPVHFMSRATSILPEAIKELKPDNMKVLEGLRKEYSMHSKILYQMNEALKLVQ